MYFLDHLRYMYFFNYITPPVINEMPLNVYLYIFIGLLGVVAAMGIYFLNRGQKLLRRKLMLGIFGCLVAGLILNILIQLQYEVKYWQEEIGIYGHNTEGMGRSPRWAYADKFCDFILSNLPLASTCKVLGSTNPGYIRYRLYPRIFVADNSKQCLIVSEANEPLGYVPKNFFIIKQYDSKSLIAYKGNSSVR